MTANTVHWWSGRFTPGDHRPITGARDRGTGRFPGPGDRPGDAGDRQDAGATGRGPRRAHRRAHAQRQREHQLQPGRGHDQRAERRDLQHRSWASRFNRRNCSSPSARTTTTRPRGRSQANFPATERLADDRGLGDGHLEQLARGVQHGLGQLISSRTSRRPPRRSTGRATSPWSWTSPARCAWAPASDSTSITTSRTTNNPDPLVPTFGHYSSSGAVMQGPSTNQTSAIGELYDLSEQYHRGQFILFI